MSGSSYFEPEEEIVIHESLEGRVLVANPSLDGSCFERTLVYICAHDADGAIGVIFNRSMGMISLNDIAQHVEVEPPAIGANKQYPVLFGGPVSQNQFMILSVTKKQHKDFHEQQSVTCYTDVIPFFRQVALGANKDKFILAQGICTWHSQQLIDEIEENSWLVAEPTVELLFSQKIRNKWQYAVDLLGVHDFSKLVSYSGDA